MTKNYWFLPNVQDKHQDYRLFCFPPAGGGASFFRTWLNKFPDNIGVFPIQIPGRENRIAESAITQLDHLITLLAHAIIPYIQDFPFAFFGHSMGALIAFELARELRKNYRLLPLHLFISSHNAPQYQDQSSHIHNLSDSEFLESVRKLNGIPPDILRDPELIDLLLPIFRADFTLCESYEYATAPPLECSISAFGGLKDPEISYEGLYAWQEQTSVEFNINWYSGNHFFLQDHSDTLLETISVQINKTKRI